MVDFKINFSKLYNRISSLFPESLLLNIENKLRFGGIQENTNLWLGSRVLLVFLFSAVSFFIYLNFDPQGVFNGFLIFLVLVIILSLLVYINLFFLIVNRNSKMEKVLPDFLMLMVSNLNAGVTPFTAFVQAARPEFGQLYYEVNAAAGRVGGRRTLNAALISLSESFESEIFRRTVELFLKGVRSGGQLAKLLAGNADEIRKIQELRAELVSATRSYTIFLAFIVVVIMPFLLGVSSNFLITFITIQSQVGSPTEAPSTGTQAVTFFSGKLGITPEDMNLIAILALTVTDLLTCFFIGIIDSGKPLYGLKYYPVILILSMVFFFFTQSLLSKIISISA